jgi:hypothetical protein
MRTVRLKGTLREVSDKYVYVSSEDNLYVKVGDEYFIKRYFSANEASAILELDNETQIYDLCHKFNVFQKGPRKKLFITFAQLKQMIDERINRQRDLKPHRLDDENTGGRAVAQKY